MKCLALAVLVIMSCGVAHADETVYLTCTVHWMLQITPAAVKPYEGDATLNVRVNAWTGPAGIGLVIAAEGVGGGNGANAGFSFEKPVGGRTVDAKESPYLGPTTFIDGSDEKKWDLDVLDRSLGQHKTVVINRENGTVFYSEEPLVQGSSGVTRKIQGTWEKADSPKLKF